MRKNTNQPPHTSTARDSSHHAIDFVAAVRQGLAELDRDERIPIEEVESELPSWINLSPSAGSVVQ